MGNKTQRIRVNLNKDVNEKNLIVRLEQDIDSFEIMSLKVASDEIYRNFNSNFGVVVGRVIANGGLGIPNAKISVFIPVTEEDKNDPDIYGIYPYESPNNKNSNGKRYNLLPRVSILKDNVRKPNQAFGSFPTKAEILTNKTLLKVYKKYYKYNTVTNDSGDYMIFGVPVGVQTIHMSVDITDIGDYSMTPAGMVTNLGYSPNFFTDDNTKIKPSNDLEDLPHIETQEISVEVIPFWGNKELFEIGITRQDFRIKAMLVGQFTIFGSAFTDQENVMWGGGEYLKNDSNTISSFHRVNESGFAWVNDVIDSVAFGLIDWAIVGAASVSFGLIGALVALWDKGKQKEEIKKLIQYRVWEEYGNILNTSTAGFYKRSLNVEEQIFYYPSNFDDTKINDKYEYDLKTHKLDENPIDNLKLLQNTQYSSYKKNGDFIYVISCNRKKIITNEIGTNVEVPDENPNGFFSEFCGFMTIDIDPNNTVKIVENVVITSSDSKTERVFGVRSRIKIPQKITELGGTITTDESNGYNNAWRGQVYRFKSNKKYSVARFHPLVYHHNKNRFVGEPEEGFLSDTNTQLNHLYLINTGVKGGASFKHAMNCSCLLTDLELEYDVTGFSNKYSTQIPRNLKKYSTPTISSNKDGVEDWAFISRWLNLSLYLPQFGYAISNRFDGIKTNQYLTSDYNSSNYTTPNLQILVGNIRDTSRYLRPDINWSDFIEVDDVDIHKFVKEKNNAMYDTGGLVAKKDNYRYGKDKNSSPKNGSLKNYSEKGYANGGYDNTIYFYKGAEGADCVQFLFDTNIM